MTKEELRRLMTFITEAQYQKLRRMAFEQNTTIADLIRRAVEDTYGPFADPEGKTSAA